MSSSHLAALLQEAEHGEALYRTVNVEGTLKLCREAARAGVERFVHCSTMGVHGDVKEIPCKETSPLNPMDLYHRTKLADELAVLDFPRRLAARRHGGHGQPAGDGLRAPAMTHAKFFRVILRRRTAGEGPSRGLQHRLGRGVTLNELARTVADLGGVSLPRVHIPVFPMWLAGVACELAWAPFRSRPPLFAAGLASSPTTGPSTSPRPGRSATSRAGITAVAWRRPIRWYREQGLV